MTSGVNEGIFKFILFQTKKGLGTTVLYKLYSTVCRRHTELHPHCIQSAAYWIFFKVHIAESVSNSVSHQQLAAPRSAFMAGVLLQTVANVREAGEEATVPAVWGSLFPLAHRHFLTLCRSSLLFLLPFSPRYFCLSIFLFYFSVFIKVHTHANKLSIHNRKWQLDINQIADLHIRHFITHRGDLSNGNSKGALPHPQQWVINVSLSPENSLLVQKDTGLHLPVVLTVMVVIFITAFSQNYAKCSKIWLKQSRDIKIKPLTKRRNDISFTLNTVSCIESRYSLLKKSEDRGIKSALSTHCDVF